MSATATHPYIEALLSGCEIPRGGIAWLNERRARALERANALAVPTTRDEEWRFTDLSLLVKTAYQPVADAPRLALADIAGHILPESTIRLVFVDGVYAPALSVLAGLPDGVIVFFTQEQRQAFLVFDPDVVRFQLERFFVLDVSEVQVPLVQKGIAELLAFIAGNFR